MSESLYEVIGVSPNADTKEIETKCLELGKKYHPKTNPDDLDAAIIYKQVMEAYTTLRDPAKRASYDATLKAISRTQPVNKAQESPKIISSAHGAEKLDKPSILLSIGIIILPIVFFWFLLNKKYSTKLKLLVAMWLAIWTSSCQGYMNSPEYQERAQKHAMERQEQKLKDEQEAKSDKGLQNRIMGTWKSGLKDVLIDPDSANFKNIYFVIAGNRTPFACGEVNSKNRLGGYTGYKHFITAGLKEYTFMEGETKAFDEWWKQVCVEGMRIE